MAVAHDVESGLAVRPSWGAACGANAVGEQELIESVIQRLPSRAVVMGDRNFGVFSVAWTALQHGNSETQHEGIFGWVGRIERFAE